MLPQWMPAIVVNSFALSVLIILLVDFSLKQNRMLLPDQSLYRWMILLNITLLLLDSGTWLLNGQTFPQARLLNLFCTTAYYCLTPMMSLLYVRLCDIKLGVPPAERERMRLFYYIPLVLNFVLSIASVRYSLLFHVSADNVYSRGSLLGMSFLLSYSLLAVAFFRVFHKRRQARKAVSQSTYLPNRQGMRTLLIFPLLPLAGGLAQAVYNQITVVWLTTVAALLIVYINMQNIEIATDALTGLNNRRQTDAYLWGLIQDRGKYPSMTLAILDINHFKQINDQYGHITGDSALKAMAEAMRSVCGKDAFYSRYGGDEFVIVSKNGSDAQTREWVKQINQCLECYANANKLFYSLSVSAGIAIWSDRYDNVDAFFSAADTQLYENKRQPPTITDR